MVMLCQLLQKSEWIYIYPRKSSNLRVNAIVKNGIFRLLFTGLFLYKYRFTYTTHGTTYTKLHDKNKGTDVNK